MTVDEEQLRRLRALALEPQRLPLGRNRPWPSSHGKFIDQAREIHTLRAALREALAIIEVHLI